MSGPNSTSLRHGSAPGSSAGAGKVGADDPAAPDVLIDKDEQLKYWDSVAADVNGMLGGLLALEGFSYLSRADLQGSRNFLAKLGIGSKGGQRIVDNALEGGAGIGRVTRDLLVHVAKQTDVIEPVARFTSGLLGVAGIRHVFNVGLEDWYPAEGARYDLVWLQWCVGHLTDEQLVRYLERCKAVLRPQSGVIIVKENLSTSGFDIFDERDSSVTREEVKFRAIFTSTGLRIVRTELQKGLPRGSGRKLFPVRMYALKPNPPVGKLDDAS